MTPSPFRGPFPGLVPFAARPAGLPFRSPASKPRSFLGPTCGPRLSAACLLSLVFFSTRPQATLRRMPFLPSSAPARRCLPVFPKPAIRSRCRLRSGEAILGPEAACGHLTIRLICPSSTGLFLSPTLALCLVKRVLAKGSYRWLGFSELPKAHKTHQARCGKRCLAGVIVAPWSLYNVAS